MPAFIRTAWESTYFHNAARITAILIASLLATISPAQTQPSSSSEAFPDTDTLMPRVAQHQKEIETQMNQYTFTDNTTLYTLDKKGQVRNQHTDMYYVTPTAYEFFILHMQHDGKPVSDSNLSKQEKEIEHKMHEDERKSQKPDPPQPKDKVLFADIILKSRFTPLRWEEVRGQRMVVYAFEPKTAVEHHGDLWERVAGDMKGKMWISPDDATVTRIEFTSLSPISLGMGILGNVKGFDGYIEQQKVRGEIWLPTHQEFSAQGRQLVSGFRIRQVSEYTDYLKASTDVFQQIHSPSPTAETTTGDTTKVKTE